MKQLQNQLPLRDPRYSHPLCAMPTAKVLLGQTEDGIFALLDEGAVVAVDIRTPDAIKRDLRILTASIAAHLAGDNEALAAITPERAVQMILAPANHARPVFLGTEIKRLLNCGRKHVVNLVTTGALPLAPGSVLRRGVGGTPTVERAALERFLTSRIQ